MSSSRTIALETKCLIMGGLQYDIGNKDFSDFAEVFIYTHNCSTTLSSVKARDLHLHTSSFWYPSGFKLILDGDDGKAPGQGTNAVEAQNGFSSYFSSSKIRPIYPFNITARGGHGYDGPGAVVGAGSGEGAAGGNGGKGGKVVMLFNDVFRILFRDSRLVRDAKTRAEKKANLISWLATAKGELTAVSSDDYVAQALKTLDGLVAAQPATTDEALDAAFDVATDALEGASSKLRASMGIDVAGGPYGMGGDGSPRGSNGHAGATGTVSSSLLTLKNVVGSTELFLHPDQVAMTVAELENLYFVGTQDAIAKAINHVKALKDRLGFLDQLKPSDPLFKSYMESEARLMVVPSGGDVPTSISSLKTSLSHVRAMERRLYGGLDFYGHVATWVPSGSFEFYRAQLQTAMDDFELIKNNYFSYQKIAADQAKAKDRIQHARAAVEVGKKGCQADITALRTQLKTTANSIALLQQGVPSKRKALVEKIKQSADEIKNTFNVSLEAFVNAATMMAFAPGLPMAAIQAASILHSGLDTVTDESGTTVQKDYVINKITAMSSGIDGLKEAIRQTNAGGELTVDDPGAAKLMAKQADVEELLLKYRNLLDGKTLKTIRGMFDDYVKLVIDRNNLVIHYNACLVLWLTTTAKLAAHEQTERSLGREFTETVKYEIPQLAAAVERNYMDTISKVMELLYRTSKALSYVTLSVDQPTAFPKLRDQGFLQDGLAAALKQSKIDILHDWASAIEHSSTMRQPFGGSHNDSIKYELTDGQLQALLFEPASAQSDYAIVLGIPPATRDTDAEDSPFADYADIRLTRVRFYLQGAKTDDNKLLVSLTHAGSDDIVAPDSTVVRFTHQPLGFKFHYDLAEPGRIITDGNVKDEIENEYALPGPFTSWRVAVSRKYNKGLDLSGVEKAWFEFSGWSRSFV
ncbi:hypothetical protein QBC42DRAFT_317384 [Cladorrhinum samala]|uniref:Uncharacterized protein n=1 Tax=Cladorrhinum samala TaxID=585594 RepID=A0AAV9HAJ1_9PEZI|nr:hypothetical protein QBC42DRAFT_317384 [Cladorrhinum samala]